MSGIITPKVQENITIGLVKSRCMYGILIGGSGRGSSEILSGTVDVRSEGKWAYPLLSFGVRGYYPRETCAIWCTLELKISILYRNIRTFTSYQLVNYRLLQTSANYLGLDMIGDQCKRKCTTRCFRPTFKSETDFTVPALHVPRPLIGGKNNM